MRGRTSRGASSLPPEGMFQQGDQQEISPYSSLIYRFNSSAIKGLRKAHAARCDFGLDLPPAPAFFPGHLAALPSLEASPKPARTTSRIALRCGSMANATRQTPPCAWKRSSLHMGVARTFQRIDLRPSRQWPFFAENCCQGCKHVLDRFRQPRYSGRNSS